VSGSSQAQNGRVQDEPGKPFKTCLREIAQIHKGVFRLTPNQHLIISDVTPDAKPVIEDLLKKHHLDQTDFSALRLSSSACVAFPCVRRALVGSDCS
jgi:sulfite reductase (NADPH) hemoprotein beta-component